MTTAFDIDWINETKPTANYHDEAIAEYEAGMGDGIVKYTKRFEAEHNFVEQDGDDIGGLIIYSKEGKLAAVYDYENYWGWLAQQA